MSERPFDVVILSDAEWGGSGRRHQALAESWASAGHHVFFVESTGHAALTIADLVRAPARLRRALRPNLTRHVRAPKGVSVVCPLVLPPAHRLFREANAALLAPRLVDLLHDRGLRRGPVVFTIPQTATTSALIAQMSPSVVVDAWEDDFERTLSRVTAARREAAPPPPPPHRRRTLLSGLGWIGFFFTAARGSTLLTQLLAGRVLGPAEYGRANLVVAAAAYLQIIPMLGFPIATSKLIAEEHDEARRARLVSTSLASFAAWAILSLPLMALAHHWLARAMNLPSELFALSALLASATALSQVLASPLLGLKRFAHRGLVETVYGFSAPVLLVAFVLAFGADYRSMILAFSVSLLLSSAYALWTLRRYLRPAFEPGFVRAVGRYAATATLTLLSTACVLAPARLFLNRHASAHEVGLFSAYFTTTVQVALAFLTMLTSVLIPMASGADGQREIWPLFRRWSAPAVAGAWVFFFATAVAGLKLFGRRFNFDLGWAAAFAGAAALILLHGAASAIYAARDYSGLRVSVAGALAAGLGNVALTGWLVPRAGVLGAALALILSFSAGVALYGLYSLWEGRPA
ncbi:MAG TPA: oligosaccharide flippase family protein [Elusimicrobiota bacterium]|nr:oligosaccharide flippase family protein [Elusimicrobiota bacterium]